MCQSSNIKTLNETPLVMASGHSNIDRNGTCKKGLSSKLQDSENSMSHKLRKMDSSETQQHMPSSQRSGITSTSQNKMFSPTNNPDQSDVKTNKISALNNSDQKSSTANNLQNRQTKGEGG